MPYTDVDHSLCSRWLTALQLSGCRLTRPRRLIVEILAHSRRALSPTQLYDLGRRLYPRLGLVTVYRTLDKLAALDLIQRVHQPHGCHLVLRASHDHEHILLCTRCGQAEYFSGDDLDAWIEAAARRSGFKIEAHWLQLSGACPDCLAKGLAL